MAIPAQNEWVLPLLRLSANHMQLPVKEAAQLLAKQFRLSDKELKERRGTNFTYVNRTAFAKVRLGMWSMLEGSVEGACVITPKGRQVLANNPSNYEDLKRLEGLSIESVENTEQSRHKRNELPTSDDVTDARFAEICKSTFLPKIFFENLERVLRTKKQLILQGAPGTGKTFVAEKFAEWWSGDSSRVQTVQFHESYGCEDFVQGVRPSTDPDTHETGFDLTNGCFVTLCDNANANPTERFSLVIDEINRAKTSRVFGELLYLLEYRDKSVILQSGLTFSIPQNVYIIGTMNTLNKSIALVDYALPDIGRMTDIQPVEAVCKEVLYCLLRLRKESKETAPANVDAWKASLDYFVTAKEADRPVPDAELRSNGIYVP